MQLYIESLSRVHCSEFDVKILGRQSEQVMKHFDFNCNFLCVFLQRIGHTQMKVVRRLKVPRLVSESATCSIRQSK